MYKVILLLGLAACTRPGPPADNTCSLAGPGIFAVECSGTLGGLRCAQCLDDHDGSPVSGCVYPDGHHNLWCVASCEACAPAAEHHAAVDLALPAVDLARSSDAAPTYEDLLQPLVADLASPPDMAAPPDLAPEPDLAPPPVCGGIGQPCCAGNACSTIPWAGGSVQLTCIYSGDICGGARPSSCAAPVNCGYGGLPCCDARGQAASSGYCAAGERCQSGKCLACQ